MAIVLLFLSAPAVAENSLNLRQVYKAAKENTETRAQGESQIRESESVRDQVRGRFLPHISLGATWMHANGSSDLAGLGSSDPAPSDQTTTKVTLTQSLYEGGKDQADFESAQSAIEARRQNLASSENELFVEVARSFFAVLAAEQDIRNIQKLIDLTQNRIGALRKRLRIGKTPKVEVLAAEAQQAVLHSQLLAAEGSKNVLRDTFARITGLDRNTQLTDPMRFPSEPKTLQSYLDEIETRPDVKALISAVESTRYDVRSATAAHLPTLAFVANGYLSRSGAPANAPAWDAGLTLTFPLFAGGSTSARVRETREVQTQAEILLHARRRLAEEEIRKAYNTLMSSLDQVKSLEKALVATEQNYDEQAKNYRFSLTTNLDVIEALNTLQNTIRTLDKTRFEALTAWAELRSATAKVLQ
jgi:outer membrane protein